MNTLDSTDLVTPPESSSERSVTHSSSDIESLRRSVRSRASQRAQEAKRRQTGAGGKELPEHYRSSGNEATDRLAFMHLLEQLKLNKRSGWLREGVEGAESVADHMYRMGMLCMLVPGVAGDSAKGYPKLDIGRCVQMALVHDLAEAHVGDITPVEGVSREIKQQLEHEAMQAFLSEMLGGEGCREARERIWSLWEEYEERETAEAKLVKDLDRLELILQAVEYERSQGITSLTPFFTGSIPHLHHPAVRDWANTLLEERRELWASRGPELEAETSLGDVVVGSETDKKQAQVAGDTVAHGNGDGAGQ